MWCKYLASLTTMQPKHRLICVRMAIKANLEVRNYGVAARFVEMLLPLNLMDKSQQEEQLAICKENKLEDHSLLPYTCPSCTQPTSPGLDKCTKCQSPILLCNHVSAETSHSDFEDPRVDHHFHVLSMYILSCHFISRY